MVRNSIECPSTDLGTLIAQAKSGGRSGYAFSIKENGGAETDGSLIEGALPYWNIWSSKSPGEWVESGLVGPLKFQLKRDKLGKYCFSLGSFRGYNHDAVGPEADERVLQFQENAGGGVINYEATLNAHLGSYDWSLVSNSTHWRMLVYSGSTKIAEGTPRALSAGDSSMIVPLKIYTNYVTTYTYKTIIEIGKYSANQFTSAGQLPVEGQLKVTVFKIKPKYSLYVYVGGRPRAFAIDSEYKDAGKWYNFPATFNLVNPIETLNKKLTKATYQVTDLNGIILRTVTITNFDTDYEQPLTLRQYSANDKSETFAVPKDRVTLGNDEYIQVVFDYN